MARGKRITDREKIAIAKTALEHPQWYVRQVQAEVYRRLGSIRDKKGRKWPGLSTVQKEMALIRRHRENIKEKGSPLDQPWSIASLEKDPIPPEALPSVLKVWINYQDREMDNGLRELGLEPRPFSIRMAKWVARLYCVSEDTNYLTRIACHYAYNEQAAELADITGNTGTLDIQVYEKMTGEEIINDVNRYRRIIRGTNLPVDLPEQLTRLATYFKTRKKYFKEHPEKKDSFIFKGDVSEAYKEELEIRSYCLEEAERERSHSKEV